MKKTSYTSKKNNHKKKDREFILTVSMFLLNQEQLRKLFWNVKSVRYNAQEQIISVGISTTNGKNGTTLEKLRKTSRTLSDYLYDQGLTFRLAKIKFFVEKEDEHMERLYSMLDNLQPLETQETLS